MTKHNASLAHSSAGLKFYEANAVAEDVKNQLEEAAQYLINVSRRSTDDAFKFGEHLERAAGLLPERTLEKWAVERCGYTARHVRTQRAIFRNLSKYKDVLVDLAVGPTVLGKLSAAEPDKIERAIGFASENGRLRVQDVSEIIAGTKSDDEGSPQTDPYNVGGVDGLKAIIAIKVRDGLKSFLVNLDEIYSIVQEVLPRKNIVKKTLADQIVLTARLARRELESLAQFVIPNPHHVHVMWDSRLPAETHWAKVGDLLQQMGSIDSWPEKEQLRSWLETDVVPVLGWACTRDKAPEWPIDKRPNGKRDEAVQLGADLVEAGSYEGVIEVTTEVPVSADPIDAGTVKRLETMLAPFNATVVAEPSLVKSKNASDTVPLLKDALAKPRIDRTAVSTTAA